MTKYRIFGIAVVLSAAIATPALAGVIDEPGLYAFYHPNSDVLNGGRAADAMASATVRSDVQMSVKPRHVTRAAIKRNY